jgi:hypothetical protein
MQLQYLFDESFVASELALTSSSDYGLISCKSFLNKLDFFILLFQEKITLSLVASLLTNLMSFQ